MTHPTHPLAHRAFVAQPDEGESYWQPVPANGYVELRMSRRQDPGFRHFESGVQAIAPGGHVREHQHDEQEELILVYEGAGTAVVDGEEYPLQPGTSVYLGPRTRHRFVNTGSRHLRFFWVLLPGGLSAYFEAIGRPRTAGEQAPDPFPRPERIENPEVQALFGRTEG